MKWLEVVLLMCNVSHASKSRLYCLVRIPNSFNLFSPVDSMGVRRLFVCCSFGSNSNMRDRLCVNTECFSHSVDTASGFSISFGNSGYNVPGKWSDVFFFFFFFKAITDETANLPPKVDKEWYRTHIAEMIKAICTKTLLGRL